MEVDRRIPNPPPEFQVPRNANFDWRIDFYNYRRNFFKNLCCSMTGFTAMLIWIIIAGKGSWGGNSKAVVIAALIIKFTFAVPTEIFYMTLIYKQVCRSTTIGFIKLILIFFFLSWYIYIVVSFFSKDNNCEEEEKAIWIAHLILVVEACLMFIFISFLFILICCVIFFFCTIQKQNRAEVRQNKRLQEVLLNAVNLQLNLDDLNEDDACAICLDEFTEEDIIIRLPCDQRHHFHSGCIGDWWSRKASCPLWKSEFNKEDIKHVKKADIVVKDEEGK